MARISSRSFPTLAYVFDPNPSTTHGNSSRWLPTADTGTRQVYPLYQLLQLMLVLHQEQQLIIILIKQ